MTAAQRQSTRCQLCGEPVMHDPGQASEALTAHYVDRHQRDLDQSRPRNQDAEPRTIRMLRALAATPNGLSTGAFIEALAERITYRGVTPRSVIMGSYRRLLGHLAAVGHVEVADTQRGVTGKSENIWRITEAGCRHLAAIDAVRDQKTTRRDGHQRELANRAREAETAGQPGRDALEWFLADQELDPAANGGQPQAATAAAPPAREVLLHAARDRFGLGTPTGIRRRAAAILSGEGYSTREIARVFGVAPATIGLDARQSDPVSSGPGSVRALAELAYRLQDIRRAQQALHDVRDGFGPSTPTGIRQEVAAVLHDSLGMSHRDIGMIFGVTAAPIQQSLARYRRNTSGYDAAARIRDLARQAEKAE